jgi:Concanavalin A-like lectin/glucanases superfamily/Immunoglobulin domain/Cohesin domain
MKNIIGRISGALSFHKGLLFGCFAASCFITTQAAHGQTCVSQPPGIANWWAGDGDASDFVNNNNGILMNGASFATGKVGQCFSFNGINQYVRLSNSPAFYYNGSFTIEAWINTTQTGRDQQIFSKWGDTDDYFNKRVFNIEVNPNNGILFAIADSTTHQWDGAFQTMLSPNNVVPTNTWVHVAANYDQSTGTRQIYVNGAKVAERTDAPIDFSAEIEDLAIGAQLASSTQPQAFFAGMIDELSYYHRALTGSEILDIYNAGSAGKCKSPVPPVVTGQPANVTVDAGGNASFNASASGSGPITFQWQFNGTNIVGATNVPLNLINVQPADAGNYTLVVSNPYGSVTSTNAILTVNTYAPTITSQPVELLLNVGESGSLSVTATGTAPFTYQWYDNGSPLTGATNASLVFNSAQTNDTGVYYVIVSNPYGTATSSNAPVTVDNPSCVQPPAGLISWWTAEGSAADYLNAATGTLKNGASFTTGKVGQAFAFSGASQYVLLSNTPSLNPSGSMSIEGWIYPVVDGYNIIMSKWGDSGDYGNNRCYTLAMMPGNYLQFGIADLAHQGDSSFHLFNTTNNVVALNAWSHVAATYDQSTGTRRIYVNGVKVAERTDTPITILNGINNASIGAQQSSSTVASGFFSGRIDEVSLYGRTLTDSEIHALYHAGSQGKCQAPVAPYIVSQPQSKTVLAGSNVSIAVGASGTAPLSYQWYYNDTNLLAGATNSLLLLPNVPLTASGKYSVAVSNTVGSVISSNATLTVTPPPALFQVVSNTASSNIVHVPVNLVANGNENAFGFSLSWNSTLLHFVGVTLGTGDSDAALIVNTNAASSGHLGLAVSLAANATFAAGTQNVAIVSFSPGPVSFTTPAVITFADSPTPRQLVDPLVAVLPANYANGSVIIPFTGFEGDVAPLPNGDNKVTITDWVQEGRFVAGLDPITNSITYQRADTAPRATQGNGVISVADWVQVGRYAVGLDSLINAGCPTQDSGARPATIHPTGLTARTLTINSASIAPGQGGQITVDLNSQGDEAALGFSINFDASVLTFTGATLGSGGSGATLNVNSTQAGSGVVGIALAKQIGTTFAAGSAQVVKLSFQAAANAAGNTTVTFANNPVREQAADASAGTLGISYVNGSVNLGTISVSTPTLTAQKIADSLVISWPVSASGYNLESCDALGGSSWTGATNTLTTNATVITATVPLTGAQKFYRLHHP